MRCHIALVAVLVASLLGGLGGGALVAAESATAAARGPGGSDDEPLPRLTKFRVVDHNIEHKSSALTRVIQRARTVRATAITVQEICWWQARALDRAHPDWTVSWKREQDSGWCLNHAGSPGAVGIDEQHKRRGIGNVAIWTGGPRGRSSTITFRAQRARGQKGLACVTWTRGAQQRVCSVHLLSPGKQAQSAIRLRQAREVHRFTAKWIRRNDLVVLGGDFNSQPKRPTLDYLYTFRGRGHFREITPPPPGTLGDCRCTQVTADGGRTKIDYIFFSANRMSTQAERSLTITPTMSDHHMLNGWAMVDATAR